MNASAMILKHENSVIGFPQANTHSLITGTKIHLCNATISFRFGDECFQCIGNFSFEFQFLIPHLSI